MLSCVPVRATSDYCLRHCRFFFSLHFRVRFTIFAFWCEWIKMKAQHVRPIPWNNQMKLSKHFLQYDLRHRVFFLYPFFLFLLHFSSVQSSVNIFSFCLINWQPECIITFYGRCDAKGLNAIGGTHQSASALVIPEALDNSLANAPLRSVMFVYDQFHLALCDCA